MYTTASAKSLDAELKELERRTGPALAVPEDYAEFAAGLVIRSGGAEKQMMLYKYQRALALLMERYSTIMVVKSRQCGQSQQAATMLLHKAARNRAFNSLFFSLSNVDLSSISKRMGDAIAKNRWGIKSETDNVSTIRLVKGGLINFRSYNAKAGARGNDGIGAMVLDEAGFAENLGLLLGSAAASTVMSDRPNFIFISTPSAPGCTYYEMLTETIAPLNLEEVCEAVVEGKMFSYGIRGFLHIPHRDGKSCVVLTHWQAHPIYASRPNFLAERQAIEKTSLRVINREYGLKWDSGVGSYFTAAQVARACILPPIGRAPRKDPRFEVVIGIDPAGGAQVSKKKSPDYCIAMVMIRDKVSRQVTQVGLYRDNRCTSAQHIKNLERLITVWNPDRVCVETVGLGGVFFSALKLTFPSLDLVPFATTARKKVTGYGRVAFLIDNGLLALWNSPPIKRELTELLDDGRGKIEAPQLGHDDIPVGVMLAVHALQHVDDENAD